MLVALRGERDYVHRHTDEYPAYCVLNLCRLMYSHRTKNMVVSKRFSAGWARSEYPQWLPLIDSATRAYDGQASRQDMASLHSSECSFCTFACERIRESTARA
jgi:hypothetical protein